MSEISDFPLPFSVEQNDYECPNGCNKTAEVRNKLRCMIAELARFTEDPALPCPALQVLLHRLGAVRMGAMVVLYGSSSFILSSDGCDGVLTLIDSERPSAARILALDEQAVAALDEAFKQELHCLSSAVVVVLDSMKFRQAICDS